MSPPWRLDAGVLPRSAKEGPGSAPQCVGVMKRRRKLRKLYFSKADDTPLHPGNQRGVRLNPGAQTAAQTKWWGILIKGGSLGVRTCTGPASLLSLSHELPTALTWQYAPSIPELFKYSCLVLDEKLTNSTQFPGSSFY